MSLEQFSETNKGIRKEWMYINCNEIECKDFKADSIVTDDLSTTTLTVSALSTLSEVTATDITVVNNIVTGGNVSSAANLLCLNLNIGTDLTRCYTYPPDINLIRDNSVIIPSVGVSVENVRSLVYTPLSYMSVYTLISGMNTMVPVPPPPARMIVGQVVVGIYPVTVGVGILFDNVAGVLTIQSAGLYRVTNAITILNANPGVFYEGDYYLMLNGVQNQTTNWITGMSSESPLNFDYGFVRYNAGDTLSCQIVSNINANGDIRINYYSLVVQQISL
jgi:hypothetical protein